MAPNRKASGFYRDGKDWFYSAGLPSDITVEVEDILFHLHKFPLVSKCGKIAHILKESQNSCGETCHSKLYGCPGGPDTFLVAAKFCYGVRVDLTPINIAKVYCAADYLEMTEDYGEGNLLARSETFFYKTVLHNWKDCILVLQSCGAILAEAEKLQIVNKSVNALSMMACTDPSLFGWPMMMYGSLQSPGGSILWNGINTGARIRSSQSEWWIEDISYLSVPLFKRLIEAMKARGIKSESLAGAIMYYARKYLPGLGRWQGGQVEPARRIVSFSMAPAMVDQKVLLESIGQLLPAKKGKSFCRFLLGVLRVAMILNVGQSCKDCLERRIGMQLELATLDGLLIPTYSDSDNLYDTDCIERIVRHFLSFELESLTPLSSSSVESETSPSGRLRKVAVLIDNYLAEIAPDVNLKPDKMRSLAAVLPESSRSLVDGLYRALDIYFKAHPWLSETEREKLCSIINYQRLSIDACTHASQNERLPLRVVIQVLFFGQLQLRTAIASCFHASDNDNATAAAAADADANMVGQILQRDWWVTVVRENRVLRVDMEKMRTRVRELEQEFRSIKQEVHRVTQLKTSLASLRLVPRKIGCKLLSRPNNVHMDTVDSLVPSPRLSVEQAPPPPRSRHRKSFSLF